MIDGPPQIAFEFQAGHGLGAHAGFKHFEARSAERLGFVHGRIRIAQNLGGGVIAGVAGSDADAGGGEHFPAFQFESRMDRLANAVGDANGARGIHVFQQDGEFVAAQTGNQVAAQRRRASPGSGALRTADRRRCAT